ncbi:Thiol-disulfide oxidoreductase ResA [Candidatus Anstonella stagnisolia]|nr:Thiol-disulfide oxidoreductase ResA [Candidatus Anstonella stagnisolia]
MEKSTLYLIAVLALIAVAILYIESTKPQIPSASAQSNAQQNPAASGAGAASQQNPSDAFSPYPKAPELTGITGYINAPSNLTLASLRGKVVLMDFWTYSCINCIRAIPFVESWHEKYAKDGLVVIGVHTPEFDFEKNYSNVQAAVEKFGIKYPVVLDSDYATWGAYQNNYWPHDYLIDANGRVRFDHIGEGGYDETESEIVQLLTEARHSQVDMNSTKPSSTEPSFLQPLTPEIYLGNSFRRAPLGNVQPLFEGQALNATIPASLEQSVPYLEGSWINKKDAMELAGEKGAVELIYSAKNANIVAGSPKGSTLRVFLDGKPVSCDDSGADSCTVNMQRLYSLTNQPSYGTHRLRFEIEGSGFGLFTFTFG